MNDAAGRRTRSPEDEEADMSMLISFLLSVFVIALVLYLVSLLPLERRVKQVALIIVAVIGVLSLLRYIALL